MRMNITKRKARELLGVNDAGLAKFFSVTPGAVSQWADDAPLPELRQLQAIHRAPDIFGQAPETGTKAETA